MIIPLKRDVGRLGSPGFIAIVSIIAWIRRRRHPKMAQFRIEFNVRTQQHKDKIKDNSLIFKEGYFDSMGFMVLISFIEEEFGIKTNDTDLLEENFESINAISEFVNRKSNNQ